MSDFVTGVVKDARIIEIDTPLPYARGLAVTLRIEPVRQPDMRQQAPAVEGLRSLANLGSSGLSDVSENKYRYLAEAYAARSDEAA